MRSPRADAELTPKTVDGVEIDVCPQTRGVWLDPGELDKLADDKNVADSAITPDPEGVDAGPLCPRCQASGSTVVLSRGSIGATPVFRCRACQGVWLDGDAVDRLIGRTNDDEVAEIEREASMMEKSMLAENAVDTAEDATDLLGGLASLFSRLF